MRKNDGQFGRREKRKLVYKRQPLHIGIYLDVSCVVCTVEERKLFSE